MGRVSGYPEYSILLLVYGAAIAAATVCLFAFLFHLGRARAFPTWMETMAVIDILIVVVVSGFTFALALPIAFFVDLADHSFGSSEAVALAVVLGLGLFVFLTSGRLARRIAAAAEARNLSNPTPAPANDATPSLRGRAGQRPRRRAA